MGWNGVYGFKMSCMKRTSMREPVVAHVNSQAVVTTSCLIKEVDIQTCRKEELIFCSPFYLEITKKDYVQALVTYFDVAFTHCHQKTKFSTSPFAVPTHWRQTVFYLEDYMTAQQGEVICGSFRMWPNDRNYRDLEFEIFVQHEGELTSLTERNLYKLR